ncbi:hypothetical protein EYF80_041932 [Liparis tanakae]|uniref:Uncharacterized protein n=1 Tax=Liparis tanakae TaxID=230148 RepID=A0A4Z2G3I7_9TELE|nr:hypothetical protein EYF80_041932 [Liparis tanakae]
MEPYQLDEPGWGAEDRRLREEEEEEEEEESSKSHSFTRGIHFSRVCAHLARSVRLFPLLDRSSSLSYRRGLSKKYALELKLWLLIIPPGA